MLTESHRIGDGIGDLLGHVLLLGNVVHHVVHLVDVHVLVRRLQCVRSVLHRRQHLCVGVGALQRLALHFDRRQGAIDLLQLLLVALLPLQRLDGGCYGWV